MSSALWFGGGWPKGTGTTAGTQKITICQLDNVPTDSVFYVKSTMMGKTSGAALCASWTGEHRAKSPGSVLSLVGSLQSLLTMLQGSDLALSGAVPAIEVVGSSILLTVTGVTGQTIEWMGDMFIRVH